MPRPFPLPFNIGTDICSVRRILNIISVQGGGKAEAFLRRILTDKERDQFQQKNHWKTLHLWQKAHEKKLQLDRRRLELGISERWRDSANPPGNGEEKHGETAMRTTAHMRGHQSSTNLDPATNDQARSEYHAIGVDNVGILRRLDGELNEEQKSIQVQLHKVAHFLAGRFAAKEAAMKAHRRRRLTWHDIWIRTTEPREGMSQAPQALVISEGGAWEDAQIVPLSISHEDDYATAVCMAYEGS